MDRYFYVILCLYWLSVWIIILLLRRDLKKELVLTGLIGGLAGMLAEIWYFKDYWHPPGIFMAEPMIEDFVVGFGVAGVSSTIFDFLSDTVNVKRFSTRRLQTGLYFISGALVLIFLYHLRLNSEIVSMAVFLFFSTLICITRKDLLKPSIYTGLISLVLILPFYFIFLNWVTPEFFSRYWFLYHTTWGVTVFGNVPLTELLWYFTWGCLAGGLYEFTAGYAKRKRI